MKKVGIMQPYIFPYLGYFQVLNAVDEYVIYDDVQFIKGGWINRNNILVNGQKILFTLGLEGASPNKLINEIKVGDSDLQKLPKTLAQAYARAPQKAPVLDLVTRICNYGDHNLARFIGNSLHEIAAYLEIPTKLVYSSSLKKDTSLKGQDKVLAICKELGAEMYINSIGGQELYDRAAFSAQGVELKFLKSDLIEYPQLGGAFMPGLSIIDVMMFNSPAQTRQLLEAYELI